MGTFVFLSNVYVWNMPVNKVGKLGEDIATRFLVEKGFTIIERNKNLGFAEIDIICEKEGTVHFVEVKSNSINFTEVRDILENYKPEERVDRRKIEKIAKAAEVYMHGRVGEWQIDVAGVLLDQGLKKAKVSFLTQEF